MLFGVFLTYFLTAVGFVPKFNHITPTLTTKYSKLQRNEIYLNAKIKKKTNSKRSLDIDDDDDVITETADEDFQKSLQVARNKINQLQANNNDLNKENVKIKSNNDMIFDVSTVTSLVTMDSDSWKAIVLDIINDVLSNKFNISPWNEQQNITLINPNTTADSNITQVNKSVLIKSAILSNRIEVIISNGAYNDGAIKEFDAEELRNVHKELYDAFEFYDTEHPTSVLDVVNRYEV